MTCRTGEFLGISVFHASRRSCSISLGCSINSYVGRESMISVFAYFFIHFTSKSHTFRHMDSHPDPLARQWPNFTDLFSTVIATRIHLSWSDLGKKGFFGTPYSTGTLSFNFMLTLLWTQTTTKEGSFN